MRFNKLQRAGSTSAQAFESRILLANQVHFNQSINLADFGIFGYAQAGLQSVLNYTVTVNKTKIPADSQSNPQSLVEQTIVPAVRAAVESVYPNLINAREAQPYDTTETLRASDEKRWAQNRKTVEAAVIGAAEPYRELGIRIQTTGWTA